jgi:predicted dehydrogenase
MNIIICGLGGVGQRYLRIICKKYKKLTVYALRSQNKTYEIRDNRTINKKINIEKKFKIKVIKNLNEISKNNYKIDFAIVCNPTKKHLIVATKLVKMNIPCLIEKPISSSYLEAKKFAKLANKKNTLFKTGYFLRIHPFILYIKKLIKINYFGKIHSINIICNSFMPSWCRSSKLINFYAANKKLGGGVLLTECHEIDLLNYLFGMPKIIKSLIGRNENKKYKVEDYCHVLMKYSKPNLIANIELDFNQRCLKKEFIIKGSKNILKLDLNKNIILKYNFKKKSFFLFKRKKINRNDLFLAQIKSFISELKGNQKQKYLDNGLNTMKLIENIRLSSS